MQRQHKLNKLLLKLSKQSLIKKTFNKILTPWYSISLIDRWLLGQIIPPMMFAISAFTVISLSVGVMFDLIRKKVVKYGGYVSMIKPSDYLPYVEDVFTIDKSRFNLSQNIKASFDPKRILNPGKMYTGI